MKLELGKVVGIWGVKGWIKLHSYTRNRAEINRYSRWKLQPGKADTARDYVVMACRPQGKNIIAKLVGIDDADAAQALNGHRIFVNANDLPELPQDEYYWHQLIGLRVSNTENAELGVVDSIIETGANDVLVIKAPNTEASDEVLIPYSREIIQSVDFANSRMIVDWELGYFE